MVLELFHDGLKKENVENMEIKRNACRAIIVKNKAILLIQSVKKNHFMLPGGGVEENETFLKCLKRELLEEVGMDVSATEEPFLTIREYFKTGCYVNHYYICSVVQEGFRKKLTKTEEQQGMKPKWIHQNDVIWFLANYESKYPFMKNVHDREVLAIKNYLEITNSIERWKLFNRNGEDLNKTALRGDKLNPGEYHKVVHIWIKNNDGEILIQKRSPNKSLPNLWSMTGGSLTSEDIDDLDCAVREVKEELGLTLLPSNGKKVQTVIRESSIVEVWLFTQDINLKECVLQLDEVIDVALVSKKKILKMLKSGSFYASINILDLL